MRWEHFERLVAAMARELDGAYKVRRYGRPGQAQHGLDIVGFFTGRAPTAYQAKDWQQFRAADLESAVLLYSEGTRPFGADRLAALRSAATSRRRAVSHCSTSSAQHRRISEAPVGPGERSKDRSVELELSRRTRNDCAGSQGFADAIPYALA
jgi:hypothetical protein